jgi:hypothetical protein
MALGDRLKSIRDRASQELEAVKRDPGQALRNVQADVKERLSEAKTLVQQGPEAPPEHRRQSVEGRDARSVRSALATPAIASVGSPDLALSFTEPLQAQTTIAVSAQTAIERLLKTRLPDWGALLTAAAEAKRQRVPMTEVGWAETGALRSSRGLRRGDDCDVWTIEGGLCLYRHPGILDRLFGWLFGLLARLFAPLLHLRARFDAFLVHLAARLGPLFPIVGIPLALIGFVVDAVSLLMALVRALPRLGVFPVHVTQRDRCDSLSAGHGAALAPHSHIPPRVARSLARKRHQHRTVAAASSLVAGCDPRIPPQRPTKRSGADPVGEPQSGHSCDPRWADRKETLLSRCRGRPNRERVWTVASPETQGTDPSFLLGEDRTHSVPADGRT